MSATTGQKRTNRFTLFGNNAFTYIPDEIISGSFATCSRKQLKQWEEYDGTIWLEGPEEIGYYTMDDKEFWDAVEEESTTSRRKK
jgi:hypothetical protein